MALVDVDSWPTEYESCKRLSQMLSSQLQQRDNGQPLSAEYNRLTSSLQIGLKQFENELQQLKDKTFNSSPTKNVSQSEIEGRNKQINLLQAELKYLQLKFSNAAREELFGSPGSSGIRSSDPAVIETNDVNTLKQKQIDIMEQQNRGLEALSATIARQGSLAARLGQEVEDQIGILDDLTDSMDRVETRVTVETSNLSTVNRKDSTWGYWLLIILLGIGIVVTILL